MRLDLVEPVVQLDEHVGVEAVLVDLFALVAEVQDEDVAVAFEVSHDRKNTPIPTRE